MKQTNGTKKLLSQVWRLTRSYWKSEEKKKAYALLVAILLLTLAVVAMLVLLNQWNNAFYTALQNYQTEEIFHQLKRFTVLAFLYIILAVYAYYLQQVLVLNWRRWLTNRYIDRWLQHQTYYRLEMFGKEMDNPDQRISEDVNLFVTKTLGFFVGIVKALCTLVSFVVILWQLSGPFSFALLGRTWHIPGYMVWVAVAYAALGTWLTHRVGHKLVALNFSQQRREADFRFSMMRMRENAESVAFYQGERSGRPGIQETLCPAAGQFLENRSEAETAGMAEFRVFPDCHHLSLCGGYSPVPAPGTDPGGLMQVATAFGRVQDSLSYFVDVYASLAEWQAVVDRLTGFEEDMARVQAAGSQSHVERLESADGTLRLEPLEVDLPDGRPILKPLDLNLAPGTNVLIKGISGSGKSTLLRALAGIWPFARGKWPCRPRKISCSSPSGPTCPWELSGMRYCIPAAGNFPTRSCRDPGPVPDRLSGSSSPGRGGLVPCVLHRGAAAAGLCAGPALQATVAVHG